MATKTIQTESRPGPKNCG